MEANQQLDRRRYLAAKSEVEIRVLCTSIQQRYVLPAFSFDVEVEGRDSWTYASAMGESLGFVITRITEFDQPSAWAWMWGAPDRANYQIILHWNSSRVYPESVLALQADLERLLGCPVMPYPDQVPIPESGKLER